MISYTTHKDPARMLRLAVLDDVSPLPRGTVLEYWQGQTDFEPRGVRQSVFSMAARLYKTGRLELFQKRLGGGLYSYRAVVL